jgi:DNA repair protein RadC
MTKIRIPKVKFTYRITRSAGDVKINSSDGAFYCVKAVADMNLIDKKEQVIALYSDRACNLIGASLISTGGQSGCVIDAKILFSEALLVGAANIILAHNHPSGNLQPSAQDKEITRRLSEGAKLLELRLLDHLIFSRAGFYSLYEQNAELFGG